MCGIVGYIGQKSVTPLLIEGLKRLEYRGYDSAGVAVLDGRNLNVVRASGRISGLEEKIERISLDGMLGIGHTRWATAGQPSEKNGQPQVTAAGKHQPRHCVGLGV